MSPAARVLISAPTAQVWRVLADISTWPQWSPSVVAVTDLGVESRAEVAPGQPADPSAYRVEQPPLPTSTWTITDWRPQQAFTWQTRGVSTLQTVTYALSATDSGTQVVLDLEWSGSMAWMARAAYGPIAIRHAQLHLTSLARPCEVTQGPDAA